MSHLNYFNELDRRIDYLFEIDNIVDHYSQYQNQTYQNFYSINQQENQNNQVMRSRGNTYQTPPRNILQRNTEGDQSFDNSDFSDLLKCFICYSIVQDAHMCPYCSKICCAACIKQWLTQQRPTSTCPHCRSYLSVRELVNCRFINEFKCFIFKAIKKQKKENNQQQQILDKCQNHTETEIKYYCVTCSIPICSDCAMMGEEHKSHQFEQIAQIYLNQKTKVFEEIENVCKRKNNLIEKKESLVKLIEKINNYRMERQNVAKDIYESDKKYIWFQYKEKKEQISKEVEKISQGITLLEQMCKDLGEKVQNSKQSQFIQQSEEMIENLQNADQQQFLLEDISAHRENICFQSNLIPEFLSDEFEVNHFSEYKTQNQTIYSHIFNIYGIQWRLKIYPNGNGQAIGQFISVFLEMVNNISKIPSKYVYKIEMINQKDESALDKQNLISREFSSEFSSGECWGYNKFYKLDLLENDGFLINNKLILKYYIRCQNFQQQCSDQQIYIENLEKKLKQKNIDLKNSNNSLILKENYNCQNIKEQNSQLSQRNLEICNSHKGKSQEIENQQVQIKSIQRNQQLLNQSKIDQSNYSLESFSKMDHIIQQMNDEIQYACSNTNQENSQILDNLDVNSLLQNDKDENIEQEQIRKSDEGDINFLNSLCIYDEKNNEEYYQFILYLKIQRNLYVQQSPLDQQIRKQSFQSFSTSPQHEQCSQLLDLKFNQAITYEDMILTNPQQKIEDQNQIIVNPQTSKNAQLFYQNCHQQKQFRKLEKINQENIQSLKESLALPEHITKRIQKLQK